MPSQRINRYLADCGLGSRRQVEALITAGRVRLNGCLVAELSSRVDPECDRVEFDGRSLKPTTQQTCTWLFHKPRGCLCTRSDPRGRPTIWQHLSHLPPPFQAVGRLDFDSSGLLLITNDGDLAQRLMHPRFEVSKIYEVRARGPWDQSKERSLETGVEMREGGTGKAETLNRSWVSPGKVVDLRLRLRRGKKREIRYSLGALDMEVLRLHRVQLGKLKLAGLAKSKARCLTEAELKLLDDTTD